ncbi:MAG TPA: type III secretion protein [Xanthomonadaceae bacterium]|nr:type III secretion protein [Xanthomonadaceae bacterium]
MESMQPFLTLFGLATLRYLPLAVLPALSPLAWAPTLVRIVVMLALAWLTVLALPEGAGFQGGGGRLVLAILGELMVGAVFGLAFMLPSAALHSAGWVVDMQAGLGAATLFNPGSESGAESLLGHALMLAMTVLFFVLDLHLLLFRAIAASTQWLPPGGAGMRLDVEGFMQLLGASFVAGVMVVAPVVVGLFCVDLGVGYASRSMPQANVYFLALPLKIAVAIGLLALTLAYAPALMGRLFGEAAAQVPSVLGGR